MTADARQNLIDMARMFSASKDWRMPVDTETLAKLEAAALRFAAGKIRETGERLTTELGPKHMADYVEDLIEEL